MPINKAYDYTSMVMTKNMQIKMQRRNWSIYKRTQTGLINYVTPKALKYEDEFLREILLLLK